MKMMPEFCGDGGAVTGKRVFISYARESSTHVAVVRRFWEFLRANGVDARWDGLAAQQRRDWALWAAEEIRAADVVLCVASPQYRACAEGRSERDEEPVVQWQARLIRDAFHGAQGDLGRFVPVVLPGQTVEGVPDFLAPSTSTVYVVNGFTIAGAEELLRLLTDQPEVVEPALGPLPAFERSRQAEASRLGTAEGRALVRGAADVARVTAGFTLDEIFVGRDTVVDRVLSSLDPGNTRSGRVLATVTGMGGIGKTALAQRCAIAAAGKGWFRGGIYWVDVRGYSEAPSDPVSTMGSLLLRWGVPSTGVTAYEDETRTAYQEELLSLAARGESVLLIVDNAASGAQVRPLLPSTGGHAVLVTSRDTLDLDAATQVRLEAMDVAGSLSVVRTALQAASPEDPRPLDTAGLTALARTCDGLPLALRIAAGLLAAEPHLAPGELADQLRAAPGVDGFAHGERTVSAVLDRSWRRLAAHRPQWAALLRLVCLHPGADLSCEATAILVDHPPAAVRTWLRGLRDAHLLHSTGRDRWGMHDLVRAHTEQQHAPGIDDPQVQQAWLRLVRHYTGACYQAALALEGCAEGAWPQRFPDRDAALAWLDLERATLVAMTGAASAAGHHAHAAVLGHGLGYYFEWRHYPADRLAVARQAQDSAAHLSPEYQALALNDLGTALRHARQPEQALTALDTSRQIFLGLADRNGEGRALANRAAVLQDLGDFEQAIAALDNARELLRLVGNHRGQAQALSSLGTALHGVGRLDESADILRQACAALAALNDDQGHARAWNNLGTTLLAMDRPEDAAYAHQRALDLYIRVNDEHGQAMAWGNLGAIHHSQHEYSEAITAYRRASDLFAHTGDHASQTTSVTRTGQIFLRQDQLLEAITAFHLALTLHANGHDLVGRAAVSYQLGHAHARAGHEAEATTWFSQAQNDYEQLGDTAMIRRIGDQLRALRAGSAQSPGMTRPVVSA